jgi:O-antigen/teichoic acid export membrane protein
MSTPADDKPQDQSPSPARPGSFRAGFAFGVLSFLSVTFFSVGSAIIASRLYGVRIVGQFALVSAPVVAMWVLSTAKEQAALIKEITSLPPRDPRVTQLFAAVFTFSSTLTVAMSTLAAIASWLVFRGPLRQPELVVPTFVSLAGYALITNTGWNIDSILSAFVAGKQLFWVRLHEVLSFIAIALAIGLTWHSVWGLVIATIGSSLTALVHRTIVVRPFIRTRLSAYEYRVGLRSLPDLLRFGLKITPGSIAQGVSLQAGVWAVGAVAPVAIVGAYSRAQMIPQRFQQVNERIVEVLYPTLVGRRARGDHHGFDRALIDSIRYGLAGMLLLAAICGGSAHSILQIFGPGFALATPALAILMLYPVLSLMTATLTQALFAVNRPGITSFVGVTRLVVTITLTLVLTPRMNITGPAIALLAGFAVDLLWRAAVLAPSLSRPMAQIWPLRERIALGVAYMAGFAISHLMEHLRSGTGWLLVSLLVGTAAYVIVFYASGGVNHRDRHRMIETLRARYAMRKNRQSSHNAQSGIVEAASTENPCRDIHEQAPNVQPASMSASPIE